MKRIILSMFGAFLALGATAQTFVSTTPANKNVVLEEYTGINCTYCPDGHKRANQFAAANPGRVVLINIHQGSYANGTPNYKTQWGDALAGQTGLTGYPSGTINRRVFSGTNTALSRADWATKGAIVLAEPSFVNVDAQASIDVVTRELTVVVEAYYTGNAETAFNMLNVALLQSNVIGPQVGASANPTQVTSDGKYIHNHMLRHLITGQWGDTIKDDGTANIPQGFFFTKTYTYTIPQDLNSVPLEMGDFEIAVFITKDKQLVYTGTKVEPQYTGLTPINAAINSSSADPEFGCNNLANPKLVVKNMGNDIITSMTIGYRSGTASMQTYNWTGSLPTFKSTSEIVLPQVPVVVGTPTNVDMEIQSINGVSQTGITKTFDVTKPVLPDAEGNIKLELNIDRYGKETTWTVKDLNGTLIKSGGPYTEATSNGTRLITAQFNLPEVGCYIFEIKDAYGDGINAGFGAGNYKFIDNDGNIIASSNGKFTTSEKKDINLVSWVSEVSLDLVSSGIVSSNIYPNPAKDNTNLVISMSENSSAVITVTDILGREVINLGNRSLGVGENNIEINTSSLSNGTYLVRIASENGISTKKFNISK
ncbi:MAG: T9SS type A sorting domain-containing protein, partial [Bacteroidales bacterium]|jgi:hypothetical protein|nr:T9SS type A sorting domain-containing protein [Bacteroidales bacterium]